MSTVGERENQRERESRMRDIPLIETTPPPLTETLNSSCSCWNAAALFHFAFRYSLSIWKTILSTCASCTISGQTILSTRVCVSVSIVSVCVSLCVYRCVSTTMCLSLCVYLRVCVCLCVSVCVSLCLICVSICVYLRVYLCLSV